MPTTSQRACITTLHALEDARGCRRHKCPNSTAAVSPGVLQRFPLERSNPAVEPAQTWSGLRPDRYKNFYMTCRGVQPCVRDALWDPSLCPRPSLPDWWSAGGSVGRPRLPGAAPLPRKSPASNRCCAKPQGREASEDDHLFPGDPVHDS